MESLLVEPGARLEENKLQLLSAKRGQCGVVTVQLLCCYCTRHLTVSVSAVCTKLNTHSVIMCGSLCVLTKTY